MLEPARTPSPPPAPSPQDFAEPMDLSEKAGPTGPGVAGVAGVPGKGGPAPGGGSMRQNQVGTVILSGVPIVSLVIEAKERLCLAQISNTLLKQFSYNEIHNRRVALGITCVQCTPVQLEILRRAGAMPISSRRCGMITKREAERLVKSFLEEHTPPGLPENFAFNVRHTCGWGCKGSFVPARYNSSRAKCIRCTYCNMFYSPNKFIFHFHRTPDAKYRHPDAANFNSWRRHLHLDYPDAHEEMVHAWEDVKAMFNGGSRKRLMTPTKSPSQHHHSAEDGPSKKMRPDAMGEQMNMPKVGDAGMRFNMMPAVSSPMPALIGQGPGNPYGSFPAAAMMHPENLFNPAESQKLNMNNLWKGRANPYYHPLGLFWAKNLGIYPPSGAGPFPGNPGMQGDEVVARELMMRGKLPPRAVAPSLQHEEMMKEKDLPLPWKHMSAFRPVGGYSRGPTLSPSGLGFTSGAGGDDNSSERISNPAMSPENVMSDVEDVADEHEHEHEYEHGNEHGHEHEHVHVHENEQDHDINVTDVLETDVNKNDIDGKGMDGEGEGEDVSPKAVTPTLPVEPKDAAEDINQTSSIIRDDKGEMLEAADNSPDPQPSQVESRIPNTILSMSKEELQRELIKMMSGKTETKNIDSTEQIECV